MPRRKFDDESIIAALMNNTSIQSAADDVGCHPSLFYERRKDPEFCRKLREAQTEALGGTVRYLQASTGRAAEVLVDIAESGTNEQNRLNAARAVLDQAARLTEVVDVLQRLDRLEYGNGGCSDE